MRRWLGSREREVGKEKFRKGMYKGACKIFTRQCMAPTLGDFLTLNAYNKIVVDHPPGSEGLLGVVSCASSMCIS